MNRIVRACALAVLGVGLVGCGARAPRGLYQVSLLNGLMLGDYAGSVAVDELRRHGDTGIGTFDRLDGELIMLGGAVYQARADGSVREVDGSMTVPFAAVAFLDPASPAHPVVTANLSELKAALDARIAGAFNRFHLAVVEGDFARVHVRSVVAQERPYRPLAQVAADQVEFVYEAQEGTIVALRCPGFVEGINLPGWHLHFISSDRARGGHVLGLESVRATVRIQPLDRFELVLPTAAGFDDLALSDDLRAATERVEAKSP